MASVMALDPGLVAQKQLQMMTSDDPESAAVGVPCVKRIEAHQRIAFMGDPTGRVGMGVPALTVRPKPTWP
jgi:hypothetical protein